MKFCDFGFGNVFWHVIIKAQETKKWTDQLDVIKSKTLPFFKGHYQKVKDNQNEEKMSAHHTYLVRYLYLEYMQRTLQTNDKENTVKNWSKYFD